MTVVFALATPLTIAAFRWSADRAWAQLWLTLALTGIVVPSALSGVADSLLFDRSGLPSLFWLAAASMALPFIATGIRRLHDVGKSGWWLLLGVVPFANLILVYWLSQRGAPSPKDGISDAKTHAIDISDVASRLGSISIACNIIFFFTLNSVGSVAIAIYGLLPQLVARPSFDDIVGACVLIVMLLLAAFAATRSWSSAVLAREKDLQRIRPVFWLLLLFGPMALYVSLSDFVLVGARSYSAWTTLLVGMGSLWIGIGGLRSLRLLRRRAIVGIGVSYEGVLCATHARSVDASSEKGWHVRLDRPLGFVWVLAGIALFIAGLVTLHWYSDLVEQRFLGGKTSPPAGLGQLALFAQIAGVLLVLYGRRYFIPTADAILAIDRRPPVLYLRSFSDETATRTSGLPSQYNLIDWTLERQLARFFSTVGPFVAIGSPRDKVPKLGAIRLERSDDQWQSEVASLMDRSLAIVAAIGTSHWIQWELGEIVARGHLSKAIFLMPETGGVPLPGTTRRGQELQNRRLSILAASVPPRYHAQLSAAPKATLLAVAFEGESVFMLTSRTGTGSARYLAAVLCHYRLSQAMARGSTVQDAAVRDVAGWLEPHRA